MKIAQCMTKEVIIMRPSNSLYDVAAAMADTDAGLLLAGDAIVCSVRPPTATS